jgi:hypothetical protein
MSLGEMSCGEMSFGEILFGEMLFGEMLFGEMLFGEPALYHSFCTFCINFFQFLVSCTNKNLATLRAYCGLTGTISGCHEFLFGKRKLKSDVLQMTGVIFRVARY